LDGRTASCSEKKPVINLPDDHDVFQGNLFGAGGRKFPENINGFARDHGGFMMPPEWVNLVMVTQTSHMPDPFDPEPAKQGIHVLYTDWKYAGISFGIIEDRKFKSGPAAVIPEEAGIRDAFVTNKAYDISKESFPEAELIGERQMEFLKQWIEDWSENTEFQNS
jgi:alkaline phosphatase D